METDQQRRDRQANWLESKGFKPLADVMRVPREAIVEKMPAYVPKGSPQ